MRSALASSLEPFSQVGQASVKKIRHRSLRTSHFVCDLIERPAIQMPQPNSLPLILRQLGQLTSQSHGTFSLHQSLTGAGQFFRRQCFGPGTSIFPTDCTHISAKMLACRVDQISLVNHPQPSSQCIRILAGKLVKSSNRRQVRLLNHIGRIDPSRQTTVHRPFYQKSQIRTKFSQQFSERTLIAFFRPFQAINKTGLQFAHFRTVPFTE